jgi:hypothetical protein
MTCIRCGNPTRPGLELCDACYKELRGGRRERDPRLTRTGTQREKKVQRDAEHREHKDRRRLRRRRRRTTCFVGFRYDKPGRVYRTERYQKPGGGAYDKRTGFKGFLKYVEFREGQRDGDDYVPSEEREDRWMDGGLGNNYHEIYNRCAELQSKSVFARRLVMSPDPKLMESLGEADPDTYAHRKEFFIQAVENTIEGWADEKEINLEYSFVVHAPKRDPEERGYSEQLHAHIILPGSTDELGEIVPFFHSKEELGRFREIAEAELEQTFGLEQLQEQQLVQEVQPSPPEPQLEIEL